MTSNNNEAKTRKTRFGHVLVIGDDGHVALNLHLQGADGAYAPHPTATVAWDAVGHEPTLHLNSRVWNDDWKRASQYLNSVMLKATANGDDDGVSVPDIFKVFETKHTWQLVSINNVLTPIKDAPDADLTQYAVVINGKADPRYVVWAEDEAKATGALMNVLMDAQAINPEQINSEIFFPWIGAQQPVTAVGDGEKVDLTPSIERYNAHVQSLASASAKAKKVKA